VADLIPHEEKCKLMNQSTYLFRGVGDLIWKFINHSTYVFRGMGDLIPFEDKWKLINHSFNIFVQGGGGFDPF